MTLALGPRGVSRPTKSGGPPPFAPSLNVQGDNAHNRAPGCRPPVSRPQRARSFKGPSKRLHTFGISVTTGLSSSSVRWKLVELLRRVSAPVRRGNLNFPTAVFSQLCSLFPGRGGCFAPKGDAARSIRSCDQKSHGRPHRRPLKTRRRLRYADGRRGTVQLQIRQMRKPTNQSKA